MKKIKLTIFFLVVIGIVALFLITKSGGNKLEKNREKVLSQLYSAIKDAKKMGKYKCCIEPPCTMCYLGDWVWKDGTCDCDGMIAKGEWDKVCPQCKRSIKEGRCRSEIGTCVVP